MLIPTELATGYLKVVGLLAGGTGTSEANPTAVHTLVAIHFQTGPHPLSVA